MKRIYFLHHLGLGDHLICNAIYRHYSKQSDVVVLPVKERNQQTIEDMLMDLENVILLPLPDTNSDFFMLQESTRHEKTGYNIIKLGYFGENFLKDRNLRYDVNFYQQANVDFEKRWTQFYYQRDQDAEYDLYKKLCGNFKEGEYIFLHEDSRRGFTIDRKLVPSEYKIITPIPPSLKDAKNISSHFFHYGYILEHAAEIHCIESSFAALIEGLTLKNKKYAHRYARPEASQDYCHEFTYKTGWEVII